MVEYLGLDDRLARFQYYRVSCAAHTGKREKRLPVGDYVRAVRPPPAGQPTLKDDVHAHSSYAVLIDGGFVKYTLKQKRRDPPITAELLQAFVDSIANLPYILGGKLHRIYFYDARPLTKKVTRPDGRVFDFASSKMVTISQTQHLTISRLPFVAMRFGELSDRGWKVPERILRKSQKSVTIDPADLEPNIQQKGVDMRIGLDIAALTLKKQVDLIVLVTGDSDLVPAMRLARREGAQVILITLGQNLKEQMYDHADVVIEDKTWIRYPEAAPTPES